LKEIFEEGTSPRFPEKRSFPEIFPKPGVDPDIRTMNIHEPNSRLIRDYENARPFAIFSLGARTTRESFSLSRPVADTGITLQMATCDLTQPAGQGASPLEFTLTPVPKNSGAIESEDEVRGFFFGGHGSNN